MKRKILTIITIITLIIISIITIKIIKNIQSPSPIRPISFIPWSKENLVYGKEASNEYILQLKFFLIILSAIGIIPIILIPIFSSILLFLKKKYQKTKTIVEILIFCIVIHFLSYLYPATDLIILPMMALTLPYVESFLISYLIARNIYYTEKKS